MTRIGFLLFYVLGMLPTYVLPYFGSNSALAQGVSALMSHSNLGLTWTVLHVGALLSLIYVAYARSAMSGKTILVALPVVAAAFDMVPGLSLIPLVPTVLHTIALVLGFGGKDAPSSEEPTPFLVRQPMLTLLGIYGASAALAAVMAVTGMRQTADTAKEFDRAHKIPSQSRPNAIRLNDSSASAISLEPIQPLRPRATPPTPSAPEIAMPAVAQPTPQEIALQKAGRDAQDAAQLKVQERRQNVARLNTSLDSAQTTEMAQKYVESYLSFLRAGDVARAVEVFGADASESTAWATRIQKNGGAARIVIEHVSVKKSSDLDRPNAIYVLARVCRDNDSDFVSVHIQVLLTLDASGTKFVSAGRI